MILDENFAILDEDEDIEDVESSEEVIDEGYIFDEAFQYQLIDKASNIDLNKSSKSINKALAKLKEVVDSGRYRNYKSSDKPYLEKAIKDNEFQKKLFSILVAGGMPAVSKIRNMKYSIFNLKGLTVLSCYIPTNNGNKTAINRGGSSKFLKPASACYYLYTETSTNKVIMKRFKLFAKKTDISDKLD